MFFEWPRRITKSKFFILFSSRRHGGRTRRLCSANLHGCAVSLQNRTRRHNAPHAAEQAAALMNDSQFNRQFSARRRHWGQGSPCKLRFGTKTRCLRASSRTALLRDDFLCRASKVTSHPLRRSSFPKCKQFLGLHFGFLFSRYISRYENLKFGFLPFVVVTIVAMVFSSAVFAARAPAMGNSADRAWQLSQLVEGVLTACNPSHGSLSCVKTNSVSFASAQVRKLNRSVCFSFPHEVGYFVGTPTMAGHCVSKQIGRHVATCQGCPRCVSRSPEARCLRVFARTVRVSQPAVLSALLVIQLFGIMIPPPYFP